MLKKRANAYGTITSTIGAGDSRTAMAINLTAGHGARLPTIAGTQDWFVLDLINSTGRRERLLVTARATDTLTANGAWEGTTAKAFAPGDKFEMVFSLSDYMEFVQVGGVNNSAPSTGTADALAVSLKTSRRALEDRFSFRVRLNADNLTTTPTLALSLDAADFGGTVTAITAKSIVRPDGSAIRVGDMQSGTNATFEYNAGLDRYVLLNPAERFPQGHLFIPSSGTIANGDGAGGGDLVNDIIFYATSMRDAVDARNIVLGSNLIKQLDAVWTAGNNAGGRFSGVSLSDTTYHCFVIFNPSTGVVDAGFDTSVIAANRPAGFTYYRRVGSVLRVSAALVAFTQLGNEFLRSVPVQDYSTAALSTTAVLQALSVPTGIKVRARIAAYISGPGAQRLVLLTSPDQADTAPSATAYNLLGGGLSGTYSMIEMQVRTNTSGQVRIRANGGSTSAEINTFGWIDSAL